MAVLLGIILGYPYVKTYLSDSMQEKISNLETQGTVLKKFVKIISDQKSKEIQENDNTENKETGK